MKWQVKTCIRRFFTLRRMVEYKRKRVFFGVDGWNVQSFGVAIMSKAVYASSMASSKWGGLKTLKILEGGRSLFWKVYLTCARWFDELALSTWWPTCRPHVRVPTFIEGQREDLSARRYTEPPEQSNPYVKILVRKSKGLHVWKLFITLA